MPQTLKIEQPALAPVSSPFLTVGTIKTVFDVSWKLIPLLWVAMQFYSNQQSIDKKASSNEDKINKLETSFNKLDRSLVEVRSDAKALQQQMDNDRQFFLQTAPPAPRRR